MSKPVYTVRCTTLESFREWINATEDDDKPWVNEANVIGNIKGIESFSVKASYGTSGHSVIEEAPRYKTDIGYQVKEFTFTDVQAEPMLKFRREHPLMVREVKLAKAYDTPSFTLIITGTCDHLEGLHVRDTKYKFSNFDVADFIDSFQWKCYLDMIGLDIFWYDFFKVTGFNGMEDMGKSVIHDCDSMMVKRYTGMERDIQAVVNEFSEFVEFKNLLPYLAITDAKRKRIAAGDSRLLKLI